MESRNREGRPFWQSPACPQLAGDKITKTPTTSSSRWPGSDPPPQVTGVWEPLPACPQNRPRRGWGRGVGLVPATARHGPPAVDDSKLGGPRGSWSQGRESR